MRLYNTLSRRTETFSPIDDTVRMYVCGVTPYSESHVGHALKEVIFDVLRRHLEYGGYKVKHVENFTDIDDKMIEAAARQGTSTHELADRNIQSYLKEMDALNVLRAHIYPRATEEIPRMVEIIQGLLDRDFAYAVGGDVYYRVRRNKEYGKLSHRSLDDMRAGSRVEPDEAKEDPMDFALWKSEKPGEPSWDSPWGPGRPGWHIECSAMSARYLGTPLDIHGGGQELVFPHHENEIAQTESYTDGQPMARFWVHNGLMRLGDDKMSKSLGNLVTVSEALKRFSPDALRLFFLGSQYRSPLNYSDDAVIAQERGVERIRNATTARSSQEGPSLEADPHRERFIAAMDDDLNTPRAIAVLFDLSRDINRGIEDDHDVAPAQAILKELAAVLGLTLEERASESEADFFPLLHLALDTDAELRSVEQHVLADSIRQRLDDRGIAWETFIGVPSHELTSPEMHGHLGDLMDVLVETRAELRSAKQYDLADRIRNRLAELGFTLEDTPRGTEWKRRPT